MTRAQGSLSARTLFLSDIHLGFKRARARELAAFLRGVDAETIVLAGDIVDHLNLSQRIFWNDEHTQVVRTLLAKRRAGARLIYIPGNHDEAARQYCQLTFGDVTVEEEAIHVQPDGKKLLVIHGDQFDGIVRYAKWLAILGDAAYNTALRINTLFNHGDRKSTRLNSSHSDRSRMPSSA